jgi:hypothetical protein
LRIFGPPSRPPVPASRPALGRAAGLLLLLFATGAPALRAQTDPSDQAQDPNGLLRFMNRLPELVDQHLPFLAPGGTYWFYARPHVGDPLKGDYFRLDGGGWLKVNDNIDLNAGAQGFIWRDDNDSDSTRYGVSGYNLGIKYAHAVSPPEGSAISVGLNFSSPLGRPPSNLTDGWRHTDPYVTYTRPLIPEIKLVAYTSVGLDLLDHSPVPGQFGTNVLHSNSITFSAGISRQWKQFVGSLTLSGATSELASKGGRQVFTLAPQAFVPLLRHRLPRWHMIGTLGVRAADGPDGRQFGASASLNINFKSTP